MEDDRKPAGFEEVSHGRTGKVDGRIPAPSVDAVDEVSDAWPLTNACVFNLVDSIDEFVSLHFLVDLGR